MNEPCYKQNQKIIICNRTFFIFISIFSFIEKVHTYFNKKHKRSELGDVCNYNVLGCKGLLLFTNNKIE